MQSLPVVRRYDLHDDAYYVVRRADSRPLAVPAWMTRPEAAYAEIIPTAHLPIRVLLELRRVSVTCLSCVLHNPREEDLDAATPNETTRTTTLRRDTNASCRRTPTGSARAAETSAGAVDAGLGQDDPPGARR